MAQVRDSALRRSGSSRPPSEFGESEPCAWRYCDADATRHADVPLCDTHLRKAWATQQVLMQSGNAAQPHKVEPANKPRQHDAVGWIYFAQVGPHIKIGWSSNVPKRARSLGANAVYATIPNKTRADETAMHQRFEACRDHSKGREWFHPVPGLMRYIRDLQTRATPTETEITSV